jgi:hypothetical protein
MEIAVYKLPTEEGGTRDVAMLRKVTGDAEPSALIIRPKTTPMGWLDMPRTKQPTTRSQQLISDNSESFSPVLSLVR